MKGNIVTKRKVFHDQIRNQQIQRFFSEERQKMIASLNNLPQLPLQQLLSDVPSSFSTMNQYTSELCRNQQEIMFFLRKNCEQLVERCRNRRLSMQQWIEGMQVLIKMINSCQSSLQKRQIVFVSEDIFCRKGSELLQSNKMDKYQILLMMMEYYSAAIRTPTFVPIASSYQKLVIVELIGLNWKSKYNQYIRFLKFLYFLLQKAIQAEYLSLICQLIISESKVLLTMFKILQEIYEFHSFQQYQPLIVLILKILINITYALKDQKLSQILMIASFREFLLQRLNSKEQVGRQLYLQLICNVMVDQPKFAQFIKQNIDIYNLSEINEVLKPLIDDIKYLCWQDNPQ